MSYTNPVLYQLHLAIGALSVKALSLLPVQIRSKGTFCMQRCTLNAILPKESHWTGKQYKMWTCGVILTKYFSKPHIQTFILISNSPLPTI